MATVTLRWHQDRALASARSTMAGRAVRAATIAQRQVQDRLSRPFPPASAPGQPPHRRSGALQRSIRGQAQVFALRVRVTLSAAAGYAAFLQRGTRRMAARPFLGLPADARLIVDILSGRRRS